MNHFELKDGILFAEDIAVREIVEAVGSPVYIYSEATLRRHYRVMDAALRAEPRLFSQTGQAPLIAYATKANANLGVLACLASEGAGADTVSEGEIRRALKAGMKPENIVFSGVGKTDAELRLALKAGIGQINLESPPEFERLARLATEMDCVAPIVFRVNPGVGAGGHAKITTGGARDKFGVSADMALRLYAEAAAHPHMNPLGLACHIGSLILELGPMTDAFARMKAWVNDLRAQGLRVDRLDLGGGLGVPYFNAREAPSPADYVQAVAESAGELGVRYIFEPGRLIAANAGILVSQVTHVHERAETGQKFVVLDAGMNDLLRPALYEAFHDIRPLTIDPERPLVTYDIVGPVCESTDTFSRDRTLAELRAGDYIAFMSAGAYGAAMSSEYNSRPLVPEVLVKGASFAIVRPRPDYETMLGRESIPEWLKMRAE